MEEIEKYIFDPRHPRKCKVYNLLLNIAKKRENLAFISPYYFSHIFENEFRFIRNLLWDPPENFDSLDIVEKIKTYINQYSLLELNDQVKSRFQENFINRLFKQFLNFDFSSNASVHDIDYAILFRPFEKAMNESGNFFVRTKKIKATYNANFICFLDPQTFDFLEYVQFHASSVIVMDLDKLDDDISLAITNMDNAHPLLLNDPKDTRILLDVLYRDVQNRTLKTSKTKKIISYLGKIDIVKYFCVQDLKINGLAGKKEIYVVGENGDGKTLFLQAVVLALKGNEDIGIVTDYIKSEKTDIEIKATDSDNKEYVFSPSENNGFENIYAYGVGRSRDDSDKKEKHGYLTLFDMSQYLHNPIKWLQYLDYKKHTGETDQISLEIAKEMLKDILDENVEIEVSPDHVIFNERGNKVAFEHLSDGYKGVVIWICDLIERLSKNQPHVNQLRDFKGIVLVDEIDLHLHPKWKFQIVRKLRGWFPNIQFIITTHSPTVILGSSEDAVFYKLYKEDGIVKISEPLRNIKNQMANTILTSPLFGLGQASARHGDVDTSDDYYYSVIHKEISRRVKSDRGITEDEILKMVLGELDKTEAELIQNDKDRKGLGTDTGIAELGTDETEKK